MIYTGKMETYTPFPPKKR